MTCPACEESARQVSHLFHANCKGCAARSVVRGPHYRRVRDAKRLDHQYNRQLEQMGVTHAEVKAAAAADVAEREGT